MVFFLVSWLSRKKKVFDELQFYIGFAIIAGICAGIYFFLPDYGSLLIIGPVALILFRFYGGKRYYILSTLLIGFFVVTLASAQSSYVKERIEYFLDPSSDPSAR